jgi:hypothetical protein
MAQFTDAQINEYVTANIGNPQAIADAAQQYGVSAADLSRATGYDANTVGSYFSNAGINFGQPAPQATTPAPITPQPPTQPTYTSTDEQGTPIYEPAYQPPPPPVTYTPPVTQTLPTAGAGYGTGIASLPPQNPVQNAAEQQALLAQEAEKQQRALYEQQEAARLQASERRPVVPPIAPVQSRNDIIKSYVADILGNKDMTQFEKTNNIMEAAQKNSVTTKELQDLYGKDTVDKYLKDYGTEMKGYITATLGDKTKSDFDKVAVINQAANKYGLDANEIAQYSGLNKKGVDQMFTAFDTGLAGIVKNLSAPTVSDLDKTKGALSLQAKYGISDDQLAKAIGGNITGKDVAAYLEPVKTFGTKLQDITGDQNKTASDIQTFLDNAKKDPRIEGLYGLAIDKVQKAVPILGLRDSISGNGSPEQLTKGYTDFVAAVNADPALKEKYGAQADAIDQVAKMSQRIADEKFGGKLQPHMFQTFIGLDQKTLADVPKQLEVGKPETKSYTDSDGQTQTYTVPGQVKDTKGLEPVYSTTGSGEDQSQQLVGYTRPVKTSAGVTVDAQYDANGTLTGYRGRDEDKVWPKHRVGISGQWDVNGKASPVTQVESPGVLKNMIQDVAALGPIGQIAIAFATSGLGSLAAGALTPTLGATAAKVVSSGLINGAMAEMGGGKFGTGFLKGAIGNPVEALTQNLVGKYMPNIDTGNATFNSYLSQALPRLASSTAGALIDKKDVGDAGLASLVGSGTNYLTNNLINNYMPDTLTPDMQKMFTGVSGQLLSSLLQGQTPDMQKAVMSTIMQNAMSPSKTAAKEKG